MSKMYVSNSKESIRLFKNPVLDALSYVHWSYPLICWLPVIAYWLFRAVETSQRQSWLVLPYLLGGGIIWTLTEYLVHRFVFHHEPSTDLGRQIHFLLHGVHHDYPNDQKRLVLPPALALILLIPFYLGFRLVLGTSAAFFGTMAGFGLGYLAYDMIHYAVHHAPVRHPVFKKLQKHHMVHHYHDPEHGFGVSSVLWDKAFGTVFPKKSSEGPPE